MAAPEDAGIVLVTGASGYIASHIILQLQQAGYKVRGTVRSLTDRAKEGALQSLCPDAKSPLELVEAELTDDACWLAAIKDCTYVIHVASPFPMTPPKNDEDVIKPAVEGTLNVLRACRVTQSVRRVVITSSMAAIAFGHSSREDAPLTESDWTDTTKAHVDAYVRSKTLAERAAWDFVDGLTEEERFELSVINPALVLGPVLLKTDATSVDLIRRLLERRLPVLPRINVGLVDVRDVAHAHIKAMTLPEAAGQRHILCKQVMWCVDLARIMHAEFKSQGYKVPTSVAPDFLVRVAGVFDRTVRSVVPSIGKKRECDNSRMKAVLGVMPRDARDTVIDMCYSLIEHGLVVRTAAYRGPPPQGAEIRFQHSFDDDWKKRDQSWGELCNTIDWMKLWSWPNSGTPFCISLLM